MNKERLVAVLPAIVGAVAGGATAFLMQTSPDEPRRVILEPRVHAESGVSSAPTGAWPAGHDYAVPDAGELAAAARSGSTPTPDPMPPPVAHNGAEVYEAAVRSHASEAVDYTWARQMSWTLDGAMEEAVPELHATASSADCRTNTCAVTLTYSDYATASAYASRAAEFAYSGVECGTFVGLGPDTGSGGNVDVVVLFRCREPA